MHLVGGDITKGEVSVCVNVFGYAYEKNILRSTAEIGDLIFTGTPSGVSRVESGDILEGFISADKMFTLKVKLND